ncbi:MAG: HTH domain-containing protein [bacterium]
MNNSTIQFNKLVDKAVKSISSQRTRDIISARFGLIDGERQTLEAIGQKYGITRERVRQIVDAVLADFRKEEIFNSFALAFDVIDEYFEQQGNVVREERLLCNLTETDKNDPERGALFFILTLGKPYQRFVESNKFYPLWTNSKDALSKAVRLVDIVIKDLEKKQTPVSFDELIASTNKTKIKLVNDSLGSYLDVAKQISCNNLEQYGLSKWPEINPRGVKDKAYIVFREQKQPLHFRSVAELINQAKLGPGLAQAQTVHNELIKDNRFILVGRGTYALKEWGYQSGTVRDVIVDVLKKSSNPLTKDEIVDKVLANRMVKKNTVLINLQNRDHFIKATDGKYLLK